MRRKRVDIVDGLGREGGAGPTSTDEQEEFAQPKFRDHAGTSIDGGGGLNRASADDEAREQLKRAGNRVDEFEAGFAAWIVRNFKTILISTISVISLIVGGVFWGTIHVTKAQSVVENTQQDVKEIRGEVRQIGQEIIRQKVRIDQIEKGQDRLERLIPPGRR
jgi:hypothetical protein